MQESAPLESVYFKLPVSEQTLPAASHKPTAAAGRPQGTAQRRPLCAATGGRGPAGHRLPLCRFPSSPLPLFLCVRRTWWVPGSVLRLVSPAGTLCFLARGRIGLGETRVAPGPLGGRERRSPLQQPRERAGWAGAVGARGGAAGLGEGACVRRFRLFLASWCYFLALLQGSVRSLSWGRV